ncbi:MAG: hypothetical protein KJZ86_06155 [Caldilineaceae bacterium]|nr:hypothetical protein [Caldilineaceae bacterium]
MMRRLFLQAVLVCALTALAAIPASAGLVPDPLGGTGSQLTAVPGAAPGSVAHINAEAEAHDRLTLPSDPNALQPAEFAPRSWGLDGGADDDQLIGWDEEDVHP